MRETLKKIKCVLLDLDGTIYIENQPIGDMKNTLRKLRQSAKKIVYLTNNSSRTAKATEDKLKAIGLFEDGDEVYTSAMATAEFLVANGKNKDVFALGCDAVKKEFENNGVILTDKETAKTCVLTYDKELSYEKLCDFNELIVNGAFYVATHPDNTCPAKPVFVPDIGAYMALFETSAGKKPDVVVGKPNTVMGDAILKRTGLLREEILMVGDRLSTDILFGRNNAFKTLLVFSGETTKEDYKNSSVNADFCLESLNEITKFL